MLFGVVRVIMMSTIESHGVAIDSLGVHSVAVERHGVVIVSHGVVIESHGVAIESWCCYIESVMALYDCAGLIGGTLLSPCTA